MVVRPLPSAGSSDHTAHLQCKENCTPACGGRSPIRRLVNDLPCLWRSFTNLRIAVSQVLSRCSCHDLIEHFDTTSMYVACLSRLYWAAMASSVVIGTSSPEVPCTTAGLCRPNAVVNDDTEADALFPKISPQKTLFPKLL